jgi:hypothetical protein
VDAETAEALRESGAQAKDVLLDAKQDAGA